MAILLIIMVIAISSYNVQGQSTCSSPSGNTGQCVPITQCSYLLELVNKPTRTPQELNLLRRSACGYEGVTPKVCCEQTTGASSQNCYTPDGQIGQCINLYQCPHIVQLLSRKPVPAETLKYIQNAKCESSDQYSICCGSTAPIPPVPIPISQCRSSASLQDPITGCCGREGTAGTRITGGSAASIDQFPWLALIEYRKDNQIKLLCGGSLISGQYVLTAAHCVTGPVLNSGTPINVRLAEYNTTTDGVDCELTEGGGTDCNDGLEIIPIEKIITHPNYNPNSRTKRNDIALIRMKSLASFSDFIRPICLPIVDSTLNPPDDFKLLAAGWGAVDTQTRSSQIKLYVDLPYNTPEQCQRAYTPPSRRVALWNKQMCAGGVIGKDSCQGDSGGPLMHENGKHFEVIGVVSFGPKPCGLENVPGVYTKVYEYNTWIRTNVRP